MGLFQTVPPVTRIVLDLNVPEWYRIVPAASGFIVSLGAERANAADAPSPQQPTIGWEVDENRPNPRDRPVESAGGAENRGEFGKANKRSSRAVREWST